MKVYRKTGDFNTVPPDSKSIPIDFNWLLPSMHRPHPSLGSMLSRSFETHLQCNELWRVACAYSVFFPSPPVELWRGRAPLSDVMWTFKNFNLRPTGLPSVPRSQDKLLLFIQICLRSSRLMQSSNKTAFLDTACFWEKYPLKCFWLLFVRLLGTTAKAGLEEWQILRREGWRVKLICSCLWRCWALESDLAPCWTF